MRLTVDTIAGEAWTSVEGPTCGHGVDGLLRGQRFMIGESPHEGTIQVDGRDQSRRTSRLPGRAGHVHAAVSECRVLSRLLRDRSESRLATWRPSSRPSRIVFAGNTAHFSRQTELAGPLPVIFVHLPYSGFSESWTSPESRPGSKPMCNEMNADVPPLLAAEAAPAPLLLPRIHLDILEKLPRIEIPVHVRRFLVLSKYPCEHPEYLPSRAPAGSPGPGSPESRSRV